MANKNLQHAFDFYELRSPYLKRMVQEAIGVIAQHVDFTEKSLGSLFEGLTSSGEAGEVTEDGNIYLDSTKLKNHADNVALAIIAHEFAHRYLCHHIQAGQGWSLEHETEADDLAKEWGFDVDAFRRECGPPTKPTDSDI